MNGQKMHEKKILITDKSDISNNGYDKIYVFNKLNIKQNHNSNIIYLSKELDDNSEYYKKKYLKFISKVSSRIKVNKLNIKKNFNLYISSLFFEKSPFKTNVFLQIQLLVLKEKLFKNKNLKVDYQLEHNSLQLSSQKLVAKIFKHKLDVNKYKFWRQNIKNFFKFFISTAFSFIKIFILSIKPSTKNKSFYKKKIFFSHYKKGYQKKSDPYWSTLFNKLDENSFCVFLLDFENFLIPKKKNLNVFYNSDFFSLKDFLRLIFKYFFDLKLSSNFKIISNAINKDHDFMIDLLLQDIKKSLHGSIFLENYYNNVSINNFFKSSSNHAIKKIFYLCEFHPYENFINFFNYKFKIYGFVHSSLRFWLLNYHTLKNDLIFLKKYFFLPTQILVSSNFAKKELIKYFPKKKIVEVESIRNFHLIDFVKINKKFYNYKKKPIFLGDIQDFSTHEIIKLLSSNKKIKNFDYKPHPDSNLNLNKYENINVIENVDLKKFIQTYDTFIFGSTSMAIEFYILKKKIIVFKDETNLNLSPLFMYVTTKFSYDKNIYILQNTNHNLSKFFNLDKNLTNWKKIIF
jgi:hypothetical protein